jgi:hypothetical protein
VNVARLVGVRADDRLQEIICHFRKKGIIQRPRVYTGNRVP